MTTFTKEATFEAALIELLHTKYGWEAEVLKNPTEADLLRNWATILFENNSGIDRLNDQPLTEGEMQQIIEQITALKTPLKLNSFINGKTVSIKRDNKKDTLHYGKEVSLKIYDRHEIAAGQSRYQIVQQPRFKTASNILGDKRGDVMLLINGMPVIHLELKRSNIPVSKAYNQIEKYVKAGAFSGIFSLVQIFVAMTPEETKYFANPGIDGTFNKSFYFNWANFNNEPMNDWKKVAEFLLSIPMAHELIGLYTVPDTGDGILKVLRSYQYYAVNAIADKVAKTDWKSKHARGGYIWHTTGSGKTLTSFKAAQLIANAKNADKVIFLMDRIELGTQSFLEYQGFSNDNEIVQATENTNALVTRLKSDNPANTLIVTSIQKMSNIKDEEGGMNTHDIKLMNSKRIVFIVDEAHRSTFGEEMLPTIKKTFPAAMFFGFTGTPIHTENQKKLSTTATIFGNELHRYSIADGIRDKNVLGFDPYKVLTYKDKDLKEAVALEKAKAADIAEAMADPKKKKVFLKFTKDTPMAGYKDDTGKYILGIEDYVPKSQYDLQEHHTKVVEDVLEHWNNLSLGGKFHAIFATNSIPDAILYYRLFKETQPKLKITALFDPTIDNDGGTVFKEEGLAEIIEDYNAQYNQRFKFTATSFSKFKKDIAYRLAHKHLYKRIETSPEQQIDLLIVVDQMLTGFDSKWINTLYLDKLMQYENIIQAFSRTNRIFNEKGEKPFGTIRYYRKPHTMHRNINSAIKLYSGDKPHGLFVEQLDRNLAFMNQVFEEIKTLFNSSGIKNFEKLPEDITEKGKFADLFKNFNIFLSAAKVQGFYWDKLTYFDDKKEIPTITLLLDETTYLTLSQRYKELTTRTEGGGTITDVPYDIEGYLTEIDTGRIDSDYMNSRFEKYLKALKTEEVSEAEQQNILNELHKSFASLTQEEQKYANIFLHDIQSGNVTQESGKTLRDFITEYISNAKNDQIHQVATLLGVDEVKLRTMMDLGLTENNINEYGLFKELKATVDYTKAKAYFEEKENTNLSKGKIREKVDAMLRQFIIKNSIEI